MENAGLTMVPKDVTSVAPTLKELDLSINKLSTLDNMYDVPFTHLRAVDLDVNNISYLNPALQQFPLLEGFLIKHNKLTNLPDLSFCIWGMTSQVWRTSFLKTTHGIAMDQWRSCENGYATVGRKFITDDWCWWLSWTMHTATVQPKYEEKRL